MIESVHREDDTTLLREFFDRLVDGCFDLPIMPFLLRRSCQRVRPSEMLGTTTFYIEMSQMLQCLVLHGRVQVCLDLR